MKVKELVLLEPNLLEAIKYKVVEKQIENTDKIIILNQKTKPRLNTSRGFSPRIKK
jgi:hypothetical protein